MSLFFQQTGPPGKLLLSDPPNKYRQILPDIMGGYESLRAPPGGGAKEDFSTAGKAGSALCTIETFIYHRACLGL